MKVILFTIALNAALLAGTPTRADTIYVSNGNGWNNIQKFTTNGVSTYFVGNPSQTNAYFEFPWGIAFDSAGNLFVASHDDNKIEKITPDGVASVFATNGLNAPADITFDSTGNLFVSNYGDRTIEKFTPGGMGSLFAVNDPTYPASGLACDAQGNVFATTAWINTIKQFTSNGIPSVFASGGLLNGPIGLAFDASGNLFVANYFGSVAKFTTNGVGSTFATDGLYTPGGIAFDSLGNLYVANEGNADFSSGSIEIFTSAGAPSVYADVDNPFDFAITPGLHVFPPKLEIKSSGTNAVVSWPVSLGMFSLEATTILNNPNWNPVSGTNFLTNGRFLTTNGMTGSSRFFRLRKH